MQLKRKAKALLRLGQLLQQKEDEVVILQKKIEQTALQFSKLTADQQRPVSKNFLRSVANRLYWETSIIQSVIAIVLGTTSGKVSRVVGPRERGYAKCITCQTEIKVVLCSRAEQKAWQTMLMYGWDYIPETKTEIKTYQDRIHRILTCDNCILKVQKEQDTQQQQEWTEWDTEYKEQKERHKKQIEQYRNMPYVEYLKTEHWQKERKEALRRARHKCQLCSAGDVSLHVHHKSYKCLGDEQYYDLIVLCKCCHERHHLILRKKKPSVVVSGPNVTLEDRLNELSIRIQNLSS